MPDLPPNQTTARRRTSWWFRLLRWLLNLALFALLGLQLFAVVLFATDQHLQIPGFLRHALEARLDDQGLSVRFRALEFSLNGGLLLRDPQVYVVGSPEPVAEADYLHVEPDWIALLWNHRLSFSEFRLVNARFYCPAEISPTGVREAFVQHLDMALVSQGNYWWVLDHFHTRFLNTRVFAQGTFLVAPPSTVQPSVTLAALYRQWSRTIVSLAPQFKQVEEPVIELTIAGEEPGLTKLNVSASAHRVQPPPVGLVFGRTSVRFAATWDGQTLHPNGIVTAQTDSLAFSSNPADPAAEKVISVGPVWARFPLADGPNGIFSAWPGQCTVAAASLKLGDYFLDSAYADADLRQWPDLSLAADAARGPVSLHVAGQFGAGLDGAAFAWKGGNVTVHAKANLVTLLDITHQNLPASFNGMELQGPVEVDARATIAPDQQIQTADFTVRTGAIRYERIALDTLFARAHLTRDDAGGFVIDVPRIVATNPSWQAEGAYFENLRTHDFSLQAQGEVEPRVLDPYFYEWWPQVWQSVVLTSHLPHAYFSFAGNWDRRPQNNALFVAVDIPVPVVRGVPMDRLTLRATIRPDYIAVYDLHASATGGGQISGAMIWVMKPDYSHIIQQRSFWDANLPLAALGDLGGPEVAIAVRPLDCPTPPVVHIDQRTADFTNAQPLVTATKIHAEIATPFRAYHVPIDSAILDLANYDNWADIPRFDFNLAGGVGHAEGTLVRTPGEPAQLTFSTLLAHARSIDFVSAISQFNPNQNSPANSPPPAPLLNPEPSASPTPSPAEPARPANLDLAIGGHLMLGDADSFTATGFGRLSGGQLGQLHMLGGLSRALANTKVPLGDFNLTDASGVLQIAHQYLRLTDVVVTGPSARVVAAGTYHIGPGDLDFNVLMFPLAEWNSFLLNPLSSVSNFFSNAVTFKLHGKVEKPAWDISMNPLRLFENHTVEGPAIPGYPANADGSPILPRLPTPPPLPPPPEVKK